MKGLLFAALALALPAAAEERTHDEVPFAVAGPEGFGISSADGASRLITHWLLQSDFRTFVGPDKPTPDRDAFVLRFAGVRLDATLARSFRAMLFANFAQNQVFLLEGWIEARLAPWMQLRAGKFLYPISEERLTPAIALPFVSTSVSAMLLPARDTGIELLGSIADDAIDWNLALTNGAVPGGPGDAVGDSGKDVVGRVFVRLFRSVGVEPLRQLGVGVGASTGWHNGTPGNGRLLTLQTYGGQTFFSYSPAATASGRVQRVVPHLVWGFGPVSAYADAVWAREQISGVEVPSRAWSAIVTCVLTGEPAVPLSFVVPRRPFDLAAGQPGAIELVAGAGEVRIASRAFPAFANPNTAMRGMIVHGAGMNWYPSRGVALLISYGHQIFSAAGTVPARPDENTVITRLQLVL